MFTGRPYYFPHLSLVAQAAAAWPLYPLPSKVAHNSRQPLQSTRPHNIAHREVRMERIPKKQLLLTWVADFTEIDTLSSKDGVVICFHNVILNSTTDIAHHEEFADRKRTYEVQGVKTTGFYTVDFTLKELKLLQVKQMFSCWDQQYNGKFQGITFEELIAIALDAPRVVGIYREIENPVFINEHEKWPHGKKFEDKFVEILKKYGYKGSYMSKDWLKQPDNSQSFAPTPLIYTLKVTDSPKFFLIDDIMIPTRDTNQVHPYTHQNDDLHLNFHNKDPYQEYEVWISLAVSTYIEQ